MQVSLHPSPFFGARRDRRAERSTAAFSLLEVLFASVIVGFVFLALYGAFSSGFGMIQLARENLRATQVLMEKMETIRVYNWDQVNSSNFLRASFTNYYFPVSTNVAERGVAYVGTVTVAPATVPAAYTNDMRQFTVVVSWDSRGQVRTRSMSTFVSRYGIQNYRFL